MKMHSNLQTAFWSESCSHESRLITLTSTLSRSPISQARSPQIHWVSINNNTVLYQVSKYSFHFCIATRWQAQRQWIICLEKKFEACVRYQIKHFLFWHWLCKLSKNRTFFNVIHDLECLWVIIKHVFPCNSDSLIFGNFYSFSEYETSRKVLKRSENFRNVRVILRLAPCCLWFIGSSYLSFCTSKLVQWNHWMWCALGENKMLCNRRWKKVLNFIF